jgi:hypothetical protein
VRDDAKVVGAGLLFDVRVGEGAHGVELDGVGLPSQAGIEPRRPTPAEIRSRLRPCARIIKAEKSDESVLRQA